MAAYDQTTDTVVDSFNNNDDLSNDTKDAISDALGDDENTTIEDFDPDATTPPTGDVLNVSTGEGSDPVELNADNVGNTKVIIGSDAKGGIDVDLSEEGDDAPDTRVVVGSAASDTITGGHADLVVETGGGSDTVNTGDGDDIIDTGADDDIINIAGGGNDTVNGGAGNDTVTFNGTASDWTSTENTDGSLTWVNAATGQTVTTSEVENFQFADDLPEAEQKDGFDLDFDFDGGDEVEDDF